MSTGCWEGPGLITNNLERGSKTALASISVLVIGWAPPKWLLQCLHPQVESQLPPASLVGGVLQNHNGSDIGPLLITASALVPRECEILCVSFESGVFIFLRLTTLPKVNSTGLQSQKFWRFIFPPQDPQVGGAQCWDWIPHSLEKTSTVVIILPFVEHQPEDMQLNYTMSLPLLPILWVPCYIFIYRRSFLLVFRTFLIIVAL